jgi:hypothetical protein
LLVDLWRRVELVSLLALHAVARRRESQTSYDQQMLSRRRDAESTVLVDYMSSQGPKVTHMRGILLVKSVENLRVAGLFQRYVAALPASLREQVEFSLATSWVPIELCEEHYAACDRLRLSDSESERLGALMAEVIGNTMLGAILKSTRQAGVESIWTALKQCGRFWDRLYVGGGVTLIQAGPKDSIIEFHGISLAKSRHWRMASRAFWLGLAQATARAAYIRLVPPREADAHRVAFAGSWV